MTYPYGGPSQYPTQSSPYSAYWSQSTSATNQRTSRGLVWVVLVLGLATYGVSSAAVPQAGGSGWSVRFATLTAVVAALSLLPRQSTHTKLMAGLAVMGFLEALSPLIDQNPSWSTIVIAILNALQALTAIAALVAGLRTPGKNDRAPSAYDAYAYYAQAAQQYYANNQQLPRQSAQAQATAQAHVAAPAPEVAAPAPEVAAPARPQQSDAERYALYEEYLSPQQPGPNPAAPPAAQPASGPGMPKTGPAESIRPGNDPATGSHRQSF